MKTGHLCSSILLIQISELGRYLSQKDILVALLSEELMKTSQDNQILSDGCCKSSNRKCKNNYDVTIITTLTDVGGLSLIDHPRMIEHPRPLVSKYHSIKLAVF